MTEQRFSLIRAAPPSRAYNQWRVRSNFAAPPLPFGHIARQRLIATLEQPFQARLTLIIGVAGSGKTTLATEWARISTIPLAWCSLNETDNTPSHFISMLSHAIAYTKNSPSSSDTNYTNSEPIAVDPEQLLDEITQLKEDICVVIDNFELLTNQTCLSFLDKCNALAETRLKLMLVGRKHCALRLGRLRSLGYVREISTTQLMMTEEETDQLLHTARPTGLHAKTQAAIVSLTTGWVAGIVLLLATLPTKDEAGLTEETVLRLAEQHLNEYVSQELLASLPPDLQTFALATCAFPWFTPELCNILLDIEDSSPQLTALVAQFPFCIPDNQHPNRYHYHPLVRKSLQRLAIDIFSDPLQRERFHHAALWLIQTGEIKAVAEFALASMDSSLGPDIIEPLYRYLADRSNFAEMDRWFSRIPADLVEGSLDLSYWQIRTRLGIGISFGTDAMLEKLTPRILASGDQLQLGRLHLLYGILAFYQGKDKDAQVSLTSALDRLPDSAYVERLHGQTFLGQIYFHQGNDEKASVAYTQTEICAALLPLDQQWSWHVLAPGRANIYALRGDLLSAITKYKIVLAEIPPYLADAGIEGLLRCRLISLYIERNEIAAAQEEWQALEDSMDGQSHIWHREAIVTKTRLLLAEGHHEEAETWANDHLKTLRRLPEKFQLVHLMALIWLEHGEYSLLESWLEDIGPTESPWIRTFGDMSYHQLTFMLDLARGSYSRVAENLEKMIDRAIAQRRWAEYVMLATLRAVALHKLGKLRESYEILRPALARGVAGGFIRSFYVPGFDTATMFSDVWPENQAYLPIRRNLSEIANRYSPTDSSLLSKREIEVLRLVAQGRTNQQIANAMYISTNTVRNHLVHISQRLNARNRQEAVMRGRELHLLD